MTSSPNPPPTTSATPDAVAHAAERLADRRAVVLPVEGTYVLASAAAAPLAQATNTGAVGEFWLAPDAQSLEHALPAHAPGVHRRLVRRLAPGPAIFTYPEDGPGFQPPAQATTRPCPAAMLTADPFTLAVLARVDFPIFAAEIPDPDQSRGLPSARSGDSEGGRGAGGPLPRLTTRTPSTIIELLPPAHPGFPYRIRRPGGYEERFIRKQTAMAVLFVCTGNTCRSPMAEAIATALVHNSHAADAPAGLGPGGVDVRFTSAGTAARTNSPASPEAIQALRDLDIGGGGGGGGGGLGSHRSRALSRRMIEESDAIFTMGRTHLQAVLELVPDAEGRARTLDPDGGDVPDPIGMSQDVYTTTARRIMEMVRARLKELGT